MLQKMRSRSGQAVTGEYVVTVMIVAAALAAMGTYVRRSFQARARDANIAMIDRAKLAGVTIGREYEPYYLVTAANSVQTTEQELTMTVNRADVSTTSADGSTSTLMNQLPPGVGKY